MEELLLTTQNAQSNGEEAEAFNPFDSLLEPGIEDFGFDSDE